MMRKEEVTMNEKFLLLKSQVADSKRGRKNDVFVVGSHNCKHFSFKRQ